MIKNLTQEQKEYIIKHYHNSQTWKIAENLGIEADTVRDYAEKKKLKKDDDFIIVRKQNKLTLEQCEFIVKNYKDMKNSEIVDILNISLKDLKQFASRRKLIKNESKKDTNVYTKEQEDFLIKNYSEMKNEDIANILKLNVTQVYYLARKLHLKKDNYLNKMRKSTLTFEQKTFIKENYNTMKTKEICEKLNLSYEQVKGYATNLKIVKNPYCSKMPSHYLEKSLKRNNSKEYNVYDYLGNEKEPKLSQDSLYKSKYGKYYINQNYFENIDNEWKAYWLGFLYADGTNIIKRLNNKKNKMDYRMSLCLSEIDREHLFKLKDSLQSEAPIKGGTAKLNGKIFYNSQINICNKKICEDLKEKGCVPNKSLVLKFPTNNQVPKHLIRHFIRGYFDGDGCIHINLEKRNVALNIMGTYNFLNDIKKIFEEELNVSEVKLTRKKGNEAFSLPYGSIISIEKIYKYLYKDCNIYLERKLNKFNTLFCLD